MSTHLLHRAVLLSISSFMLLFSNSAVAKEKLKIFLMAGQSNMQGHARPHTIATLYKSAKSKDKELLKLVFNSDNSKALDEQLKRAALIDQLTGGIKKDKLKKMPDGPEKKALEAKVNKLLEEHEAYKKSVISSLKVSDRVYINSVASNVKSGKLGLGYGANPTKMGPEYAFGLSMANKIDGPILLIKASWGGKSINHNFRPPSSGAYTPTQQEISKGKAEAQKKSAGQYWRLMNEGFHKVLKNLKASHPDYDPEVGYEIAGFVWFQGFNDQFSDEYRDSYKTNMINFINDVRKEYKSPKMPFVIGVIGTQIEKAKVDQNKIAIAQRAAAMHGPFKGNVMSVESYKEASLFLA